MGVKKVKVVFVPGLMGTALNAKKLSKDQRQAIVELCKKHWSEYEKLEAILKYLGNETCGKKSTFAWGQFEFIHWMLELDDWQEYLTRGNGYDDPGGGQPALEPSGLFNIKMNLGPKKDTVIFDPYAPLINKLKAENVDLLIADYDWRLSVANTAKKLEKRILQKWWPEVLGKPPQLIQRILRPKLQDQVLIIGHSLGGLVGRLFVESDEYLGHKVVRRLVTIGTPHMGAPVAYTHFQGITRPFGDSPLWKWVKPVFRMAATQSAGTRQSVLELPGIKSGPSLTPPKAGDTYSATLGALVSSWDSKQLLSSLEPKDFEKRLIRHFSTSCQLLPNYDFAVNGKTKEPYQVTYAQLEHTGFKRKQDRKSANELHQELHSMFRWGGDLDAWLINHRVRYNVFGASGLPTVTAVTTNARCKAVSTRTGDGTVPLKSSIGWVAEWKAMNGYSAVSAVHLKTPRGKRKSDLEHTKICNHPEVIKFCRTTIKSWHKSQSEVEGNRARLANSIPPDEEFIYKIAKDIFAKNQYPFKSFNGSKYVVCLATLRPRGDMFAMIDGRTKFERMSAGEDSAVEKKLDGVRVEVLKNPMKGLSSRMVFTKRTDGVDYKFALLANLGQYPTGVVLLPKKDDAFAFVIGIIGHKNFDRVGNDGHAEISVKTWFEAQIGAGRGPNWADTVLSLSMSNRSFKSSNMGFSPCAKCCESLSKMKFRRITHEDANGPNPPLLMNWKTLYEGYQNETTTDSLELMKNRMWRLPDKPLPK